MRTLWLLCTSAGLILTGCAPRPTSRVNATAVMSTYGCGSCHTIPGIAGAHATVGPPLDRFGSRSYIAGVLPNTPANLAFWIEHPQTVHPGSAMPEMHVTAKDAELMSRYLEDLH